jgi:hypothetical protein
MLRGLVGGYGGNLSNTDLFFDYSTSFPLFQIILCDATKLSTIPPINLEQQNYHQKNTSPKVGSNTSSPASSIHHDRRFQKRVYDRSSESSDRTLSPVYLPTLGAPDCPNPQGTPKPRDPNARGYTTDDGPWLYRIEINGQARSGPFTEIKDEESYLKMVDHIKEMSRKDTNIEYKVVLFHVSYAYTTHVYLPRPFADSTSLWTKSLMISGAWCKLRMQMQRTSFRRLAREEILRIPVLKLVTMMRMRMRMILENLIWSGWQRTWHARR